MRDNIKHQDKIIHPLLLQLTQEIETNNNKRENLVFELFESKPKSSTNS